MPYKIDWVVVDRVLLAEISGEATASDAALLFEETAKRVRHLPRRSVYLIQDVRRLEIIPTNWSTLILTLRSRRSPQIRVTITISSRKHTIIDTAMTLMARLYGITGYTVPTMAAAHRLLIHFDPSLADVMPEA